LPENAQLIASSEACANQAYVIDNQVYGFQFHLETTEESAAALIENCGDELDNSKYVQNVAEILTEKEKFIAINKAMSEIFKQLIQQ